MTVPEIKVCIVGDAGVGKTNFVTKEVTGVLRSIYIPTLGVEVHPVTYFPEEKPVKYTVWDLGGKYTGKKENGKFVVNTDYFEGCSEFVIVYNDKEQLPKWERLLQGKNVHYLYTGLCNPEKGILCTKDTTLYDILK